MTAATERLRAALRVLSVIEQAKSDQGKLHGAKAIEGTTCVTAEPGANAETPTASTTVASKSTAAATGSTAPAAAAPPSTSAVSWASATSSWIRNKRPKFWALVNETGGDASSAAPNRAEGVSGAATQSPTPATTPTAAVAAAADTIVSVSPAQQQHGGPERIFSALAVQEGGAISRKDAAPTAASSSAAASSLTPTTAAARRVAPVSAHSIRAANSVPPFRSRYKKDVAHALSSLLNHDAALGQQLLGQLSAESRRLLLIMGTASEYFGVDYGEVAEQIKEADTDRDNSISSKEFDAWVGHMAGMASTRRHDALSEATPSTLAAAITTAATAAPQVSPASSVGAAAAPAQPPAAEPAAATSAVGETTPAVTTTAGSGPTQHHVAASATLSRQRAEMALNTARAASARIIEVMQKNTAASGASVAAALGGQREAAEAPAAAAGPAITKAATTTSAATEPAASAMKSVESPPSTPGSAAVPPSPSSVATTPAKAKRGDPAFMPWPTFAKVVLAAAPPFLAFGMLDNCTLVLAGGAIDNILSAKLGLTQMAAASLGGVVSGVAGIQVHGLAERFTRARPPQLTPEQERSDSFQRAENVGNTLGMVVGLILGMTPLLFMGRSSQASEKEAEEHKQFREEASRSHQRRCKQTVKAEGHEREALLKEERAAWDALTKKLAGKPPATA